MLDPAIGAQLRNRGHDVESIQAEHPELIGVDDIVVLERSTLLGRTLVTDNVRHFRPLHQRFLAEQRTHAGLLLASSRSYARSKRTIGLWINGLESAMNKHGSAPTGNLCEWLSLGAEDVLQGSVELHAVEFTKIVTTEHGDAEL